MTLEKRIKEILAQRPKVSLHDPQRKRAAVLIPIFQKGAAYHILVTKRTEQVPHHKGQISFPGGSQNPGEDLRTTALREAREEIGLQEKDVIILGELDDMGTISSDFLISPFVGFIPYPYPFNINFQEIVEIIEIPWIELTNPQNWRQEITKKDGHLLPLYFFYYQDYLIWGATARILRQLIDLLSPQEK
ncbi:MAG: NUDIX hydrolase [Thermodesulfobacteriota bacterium]